MSTIEQIGVEFEELHGLLESFSSSGNAINDDLQRKRDQMASLGDSVTLACNDSRTAWVAVGEKLAAVTHAWQIARSEFDEQVNQAHETLTRATTSAQQALQETVRQCGQAAQAMTVLGEAAGAHEDSIAKGGALQRAAAGDLGQRLKQASARAAQVVQAASDEAREMGARLQEKGEKPLNVPPLPAGFAGLHDKLASLCTPACLAGLSAAGAGLRDAHRLFRQTLDSAAESAGQNVEREASDLKESVLQSQSQLKQHFQQKSRTVLQQLEKNRESFARTLEQGREQAAKCSQRLTQLKSEIDRLARGVQK